MDPYHLLKVSGLYHCSKNSYTTAHPGNVYETPRMKPNLIIIGAQKSGSSSLHHYLNLHPDISMSETKELDFFVESLNWKNGLDWYQSQFNGTAAIHGESSPSYTMYPNFTGVPERMHSLIPDARLVYIVRDPIERIVSHYLHQWYRKRRLNSSMDILVDPDEKRSLHYIRTSSYYLQLSQYIEFYDISRILVISLEEMKRSRANTMRKVFQFLEVDDTFTLPEDVGIANPTASKIRTNSLGNIVLSKSPVLSSLRKFAGSLLPSSAKDRIRSHLGSKHEAPELTPEIRQTLKNALRDDIEKFRELTNMAFDEWDI
jgi:Sulfotransferase domain